jgi:hypothetical protein
MRLEKLQVVRPGIISIPFMVFSAASSSSGTMPTAPNLALFAKELISQQLMKKAKKS